MSIENNENNQVKEVFDMQNALNELHGTLKKKYIRGRSNVFAGNLTDDITIKRAEILEDYADLRTIEGVTTFITTTKELRKLKNPYDKARSIPVRNCLDIDIFDFGIIIYIWENPKRHMFSKRRYDFIYSTYRGETIYERFLDKNKGKPLIDSAESIRKLSNHIMSWKETASPNPA